MKDHSIFTATVKKEAVIFLYNMPWQTYIAKYP